MGKAIFNWFLSMRSQIVLLLAAMIQDRALTFVKVLNVDGFNPFNGWL